MLLSCKVRGMGAALKIELLCCRTGCAAVCACQWCWPKQSGGRVYASPCQHHGSQSGAFHLFCNHNPSVVKLRMPLLGAPSSQQMVIASRPTPQLQPLPLPALLIHGPAGPCCPARHRPHPRQHSWQRRLAPPTPALQARSLHAGISSKGQRQKVHSFSYA